MGCVGSCFKAEEADQVFLTKEDDNNEINNDNDLPKSVVKHINNDLLQKRKQSKSFNVILVVYL